VRLTNMSDRQRKELDDVLKERFGGNVALELADMAFFDYHNNHFDGYWFRLYDNLTGNVVIGFIVSGMDTVDYHIEYVYVEEKPLMPCVQQWGGYLC